MGSRSLGSSVLCAVLVAAAAAHAQEQDFSKVELKTTVLAPGLAMLEGVGGFAGGNVAVSYGADGTAIVDDQFVPMVPKIEAAVRALKDGPIRFVINTHFHFDHVGRQRAAARRGRGDLRARERAQAHVGGSVLEGDEPQDGGGSPPGRCRSSPSPTA